MNSASRKGRISLSNSVEMMIALLEAKPHWGPELQRQFLRSAIEIRECRTIDDLFRVPNQAPAALLLVDLDCFVNDLLAEFTSKQASTSAGWPVIGIASESLAPFEWILRDAGLAEFLPSTITGDELSRVCRRQLGLKSGLTAR